MATIAQQHSPAAETGRDETGPATGDPAILGLPISVVGSVAPGRE